MTKPIVIIGNSINPTDTPASNNIVTIRLPNNLEHAYSSDLNRQAKSTTSKVRTLKLAKRKEGEHRDNANTNIPKKSALNCLAIMTNTNQLLAARDIFAINVKTVFLVNELGTSFNYIFRLEVVPELYHLIVNDKTHRSITPDFLIPRLLEKIKIAVSANVSKVLGELTCAVGGFAFDKNLVSGSRGNVTGSDFNKKEL